MRFVRLLLALAFASALAGCGAGNLSGLPSAPAIPVVASTPPTTLTGNWLLNGTRVPATYPLLAATLIVSGNQVTGMGSFQVQCNPVVSNGLTVTGGAGGSVQFNGTVKNDGTFSMTTGTIGGPPIGTFSIAVTGNSPTAAAPLLWTGTYTFNVNQAFPAPALPCVYNRTANFAAAPIAPVNGTYVGLAVPGTSVFNPFGPNATVTLQITQGSPIALTHAGTTTLQVPLAASLTVANSACPFTGSTTAAPVPSLLAGDRFDLPFLFPGNQAGYLIGTVNDPSAASLAADLTSLAQANGCPAGIALYNLVRK